MKRLHRKDLYGWSIFNERLNIDFNGYAWVREGGNVLIDPVPLSPHDRAHIGQLGGAAWIILTNSDHVRAAREARELFGAKIAGPAKEKERFPFACDRWIADKDEIVPGLRALELEGSKTPGELALLLEETTLFTGDLVRSHRAGSFMLLLPEQGLTDRAKAVRSVDRLAELPRVEAVLVGDGWSEFREGHARLRELAESLRG
jgi:glyoxylase-like metal-dependent hydrolase (beta-lactamase superfamily II)